MKLTAASHSPLPTAPMTNEEESYSLDIEDDVELDAADIVEDEEDYASALVGNVCCEGVSRSSVVTKRLLLISFNSRASTSHLQCGSASGCCPAVEKACSS